MNDSIELTGADGFAFSAYLAKPTGEIKGRVVVIQEIFGVNDHIREVCDGYAEEGYIAVAPALFDRVAPGIELGYEGDDMAQGVEIAMGTLEMPNTLSDVQAAIDYLAKDGKVGVVGYCFGGLLTWLSAAGANNIACASGYYGGGIVQSIEKAPKVPTILHFGNLDAHIPIPDVKSIDEAHPEVMVYIYDADHGFNCDHRGSYNESAAALARQRTLSFFEQYLG